MKDQWITAGKVAVIALGIAALIVVQMIRARVQERAEGIEVGDKAKKK